MAKNKTCLPVKFKAIFDNQLGLWLFFLLFAILIQLFANYDSPLHTYFRKVDSSWFYMGGKAMMNGLLPYVDFADSKGPLLWLFYGIGYLISPTNFHGVFLLHCLLFSFIFLLAYKLAFMLFDTASPTSRKTPSMASAVVFAIPLFCYNHIEMRCEDLCQLQLLYCIYCLTACIKHNCVAPRHAYLMGVSIATILLIKWNITIYTSIVPLSVFAICLKRRIPVMKLLGWFFAGFLTVILPFIIVFTCLGILPAFVNEYFFNTASTFKKTPHDFLVRYFLIDIPSSFKYSRIVGFVACFLPFVFFKHNKKARFIPVICALFMFFTFTYHGGAAVHYHSTYVSWFIFMSCLIASASYGLCRHHKFLTLLTVSVLTFAITIGYALVYHHNWIWSDNGRTFYESEKRLSALHNPKILNWGNMEYSIGLSANSLPACKYWAMQSNADFIAPQQLAVLKSRIPDIVTLTGTQDAIPEKQQELLDSLQYSFLTSVPTIFRAHYHVYIKTELLPLTIR